MRRSTVGQLLAIPHAVVVLLLVSNAAMFAWTLHAAGTPEIPTSVLVAEGALVPSAITPDGWWRLFVAGFLHAGPAHLLSNLVSLLICGPFLERRLGSSAFILVYLLALLGAGLTSVLLHPGPFVGVGASGAISGIMGALFALWVLGAPELSPVFFLVNFSLNAAFAIRIPNVDWAAHAGGFLAGLLAVAMLDLAARANALWLRCKFPEFVKMNALALAILGAGWLWSHPSAAALANAPHGSAWAAAAMASLFAIKVLDLLLAARHGLAAVVAVFACCNAAAAFLAAKLAETRVAASCDSLGGFPGTLEGVAAFVCPDVGRLALAAACAAFVLSLLAYAAPLRRGWRDVGFVGATFMGDRQRERGLVRPVRHTRA